VWATASDTPGPRLQLVGWITLLVAVASGAPCRAAHLVGCAREIELTAPAACESARAHLSALVEAWRRLRVGPVRLFPRLSRAVVERSLRYPSADATAALRAVIDEWDGAPHRAGDRSDPWVSALFGHLSSDELVNDAGAILAAASAVWRPLLEARAAKSKAKTAAAGAEEEATE
jgi:exonuclease V gamma subunit